MTKRPVIHRSSTFEFKGVWYDILNGGPGWGYEVYWKDPESSRTEQVADGFLTMRELRAWLQRAADEDWPTLKEKK